jgi:hypothetical protein
VERERVETSITGGGGIQRFRPEPLEPPLEPPLNPPLNPPLKPLFPPLVVGFRNDPAAPRLPAPVEPGENPPLTGTRDIPPARNAGALTAEERPDPLRIPGFTFDLPPLPEKDREPPPRWTDGKSSPRLLDLG